MKISTRSRYGVRLLFELALNYGNGPILLSDIGKKQRISKKYLSNIIIIEINILTQTKISLS